MRCSQPVPWHRSHLFRSFFPVPLHCRHCCHSSGVTTRNTPLHRRARGAARGASHVCPIADLERVKAPQPVQTATGLEIESGIRHLPDQTEEAPRRARWEAHASPKTKSYAPIVCLPQSGRRCRLEYRAEAIRARRKPDRCQRSTVSGWTIVMALVSDGNSRHSQTKSSRSAAVSLGFEGACRRSTFS